jgi:hypothetical protein
LQRTGQMMKPGAALAQRQHRIADRLQALVEPVVVTWLFLTLISVAELLAQTLLEILPPARIRARRPLAGGRGRIDAHDRMNLGAGKLLLDVAADQLPERGRAELLERFILGIVDDLDDFAEDPDLTVGRVALADHRRRRAAGVGRDLELHAGDRLELRLRAMDLVVILGKTGCPCRVGPNSLSTMRRTSHGIFESAKTCCA